MKTDTDKDQAYNTGAYQKHLEHWHGKITECVAQTMLAGRDTGYKTGGELALDSGAWQRLHAIAGEQDLAIWVVLHAALNFLISKYTMQDTVRIDTPPWNDGKTQEACPLMLIQSIDPTWTVREYLLSCKTNTVTSYRYQDTPFDVLDTPGLEQGTDVWMSFNGGHTGLSPADHYNLWVHWCRTGAGLSARFERIPQKHWFSETQFMRALASILTTFRDQNRQMASISLLAPGDIAALHNAKQGREIALPEKIDLYSLFTETANRYPERQALVQDGIPRSYAQLLASAERMGAYLVSRGVKPGDVVAVMSSRSHLLPAAMLSVARAGAIYLPIDPAYPKARRQFMLEDARASVLLTEATYLFDQEEFTGEIFALDLQLEALPEAGARKPLETVSPEAYLIYTSGSSGRPKGVLVGAGALLNLCRWHVSEFAVTSESRATMLASIGFDASIWEIWPYLLSGAALYPIADELKMDLPALAGFMRDHNITHSFLPSALCSELAHMVKQGAVHLDSSITLLTGGEAWSGPLDAPLHIVNNYGLTETAVVSTSGPLQATTANAASLGGPIANTSVYIVDNHLNLLPDGFPGQVAVGGAGLAERYWQNEELNRERFTTAPFEPRTRLFLTGDTGRYTTGGSLEYLGRKDRQVQLRGYRVEPHEVERALESLHGVREAKVRVVEQQKGHPRLLAWYTADVPRSSEAMRDHLAAVVPAYMVPETFTFLERFPRTAHGKIDEDQLIPHGDTAQTLFEQPGSALEKEIASVFGDVLQIPAVSKTGNFFTLGGDSILAIRAVAMINKNLDAGLEVQDIFNHPSAGELAAFMERSGDLIHRKQALKKAAEYIGAFKGKLLAQPDIVTQLPEDWEDLYPMSTIQQGMLYLSHLMPETAIYHDQTYLQLQDNDFDREAFAATFRWLAERHPILRTAFYTNGFKDPFLVVVPPGTQEPDITFESLEQLPPESQKKHLENAMAADRHRSFAHNKPYAWRVKVFHLGPSEHGVLFSTHHSVLDGWSDALIQTEFTQAYVAFKQGGNPQIEPLKASYRDFIIDQMRVRMDSGMAVFWKDELSGFARTPLPFHRKLHSDARQVAASKKVVYFPGSLNREVLAFAKTYGIVPRDVFTAAYMLLIALTTGRRDLVIGYVTHGRPEIEDGDHIAGCFLNTIPLRIRLKTGIPGLDFIRDVNEKFKTLKSYEKLPLVEIIKAAGAESSAGNPIYDLGLSFTEFHVYREADKGVRVAQGITQSAARNNFLFDFIINRSGDDFRLIMRYSETLFSNTDLQRIEGYYTCILNALIREPQSLLGNTRFIPQAEMKLLEQQWQGPRLNIAHDTYPGAWRKTVQAHGETTALVFGSQAETYRVLAARVEALRRHLGENGFTPGQRVGLCMERSIAAAAAALAVWEAGGVLIPVDPAYPPERQRYILEDAQTAYLMVEPARMFELDFFEGRIIAPELIQPVPDGELPGQGCLPEASDTAYMIYTSGSTGKPKGVEISHGSLMNYLEWANGYYFGNKNRYTSAWFTSMGFDLTFTSLFGTLLRGDTLHIVPQSEHDTELKEVFSPGSGIKAIKLTPSHIRLLDGLSIKATEVELAIVGGEQLEPGDVAVLKRLNPQMKVYNEYGPTECTVGCTVSHIDNGKEITIGRPVANTSIAIVDEALEPLPAGVPGELLVMGAGVAKGYWQRPELTASRFIEWTDMAETVQSAYRTGDLVHMSDDSNLHYLGRIDDQLKVRGYRLEPMELQLSLKTLPEVAEAVILADVHDRVSAFVVPDPAHARVLYELAASYTPSQQNEVDTFVTYLRQHLGTFFPEAMIPGRFILVPRIPLTVNGKPDKNKLQETARLRHQSTPCASPQPTGEQERLLLDLWREGLENEDIHVESNFFHEGGHSLLAVQLISAINKRFSLELSIGEIFEYPTPRLLAARLEHANVPDATSIPLSPVKPHYALSSGQKRIWLLTQMNPGIKAYNLPVIQRVKGPLEHTLFTQAFHAVVRKYEALRTRFITVEGAPRQQVYPFREEDFEVPYLDLSHTPDPEAEARQYIRTQMDRTFELDRDVLCTMHLLRLGANDHVLACVTHHIITDGWSNTILVREIASNYRKLELGQILSAPVTMLQYRDYAEWQAGRLEGNALSPSETYWLKQMEEQSEYQLPTDLSRNEKRGFRTSHIEVDFGHAWSEQLYNLAREKGTSSFVVLVALVKTLLYVYGRQRHTVLGMPVAMRDRPELMDQVGFFLNMLVLRDEMDGSSTWAAFLDCVAMTVSNALKHHEYPFEQLVHQLHGTQRNRNALFDVEIDFHQFQELPAQPDVETQVSGERTILPFDYGRTGGGKFDLDFLFMKKDGNIRLNLYFDTGLYREGTARKFCEQLEILGKSVFQQPEQTLEALCGVVGSINGPVSQGSPPGIKGLASLKGRKPQGMEVGNETANSGNAGSAEMPGVQQQVKTE